MTKFMEYDTIYIYYLFSEFILYVTKQLKSKQLNISDPELLKDMWMKGINISAIKITRSPDTLTKLIRTVINIL